MSRFIFGLLMGVILIALLDSYGEYILGFFGLDLDSYLNHILSMKQWFAEFLHS